MRLRQRFAMGFGSLEIVLLAIASYIPLGLVHRLVLALFGARIGSGCALHHGLQIRSARRIVIGEDCFIAENVILDGRGGLVVGDHVSINSGVQIWTPEHDIKAPDFAYLAAPVSIGSHAWICSRSVLLPGCKISDRPRVDQYRLNARASKIWWW